MEGREEWGDGDPLRVRVSGPRTADVCIRRGTRVCLPGSVYVAIAASLPVSMSLSRTHTHTHTFTLYLSLSHTHTNTRGGALKGVEGREEWGERADGEPVGDLP